MNNEEHISELKLRAAELECEYWETKISMVREEKILHNNVLEAMDVDVLLNSLRESMKEIKKLETTRNIDE